MRRLLPLVLLVLIPAPSAAHADGCPLPCSGQSSSPAGSKLLFVQPTGARGALVVYDTRTRKPVFRLPAGIASADGQGYFAAKPDRGGGTIVNTSSICGLAGIANTAAYTAAKHGVVGLTKTAALEFSSKGIRVNAVCPGFIRTPMVERILDKGGLSEEQIFAVEPMHRMGKPEEIAEAVLWLCSDASSFVTGLPMPVDGGYVAQ